MKNYLLLLGIISMFILSACSSGQQQMQTTDDDHEPGTPEDHPHDEEGNTIQTETPAPGHEDVEEMVVASGSGVKEFNMIAKQWDFAPSIITVSEGDTVKLNIENIDAPHGFMLAEFGVNERLEPGKTTTVEFTADKAGEYTFFCNVPCGRGHGGMNGKLIVE
jgi:cytochrome c oxidase subunit 2